MVEHAAENRRVSSSILDLGIRCVSEVGKAHTGAPASGSGSAVEHLLAKERVAGSNPVFRSGAT